MMGTLPPEQNKLFYEFSLEKHIPQNHLLRQIDQFLDFNQIRQQLDSFYSHTGRPSIDPELMIRMLLVGYCYGIRSERRLCEEVNFNLAYRWFCKIGLEDEVPNHSTFSKNRLGRYRDANIFRFVFDAVVQRCHEEGLVKGEGFAIDASYIRADVSRQRAGSGPIDWGAPKQQSRAVREYLDAMDTDASYHRKQKSISLTDPMSQWSARNGFAQFFYSTNYLIDVWHGVIMDVEGSPSTHALEVGTTKTMIERVENKHGIVPKRLMGDTAYGTAANLGYLVEEKHIAPHIPVWEKSPHTEGIFPASDFIWHEEDYEYRCPAGKVLRNGWRKFKTPRTGIRKDNFINFTARKGDCDACSFKPRCCPGTDYRKLIRSVHEKARDITRAINQTDEYKNHTFHERKKVEMCFAQMKRNLRFDRLRLRGIKSANDEFLLVACAHNLMKMAKYLNRPPPFYREAAPEIP